MANGQEKLSKNWKPLAADILRRDPDCKAPAVRRQLIVLLGEDKTPGLSAVQKILAPMRGKYQKINDTGIEAPWHLGLIAEYPIPSEALPYVLALKKWVSENNQPPLTVRQVLWASRLYPVVCGKKLPVKEKDIQALWAYSGGYAWYEGICYVSGTDFNTNVLDEALIGLRKWRDAMFSLIAPVEFEQGRVTPDTLGWLLEKTKGDPSQRTRLMNKLHLNTTKDGER